MEALFKYCSGAVMAGLSLLAPIQGLVICAVIFIAIDFVTGVAASYKKASRAGSCWTFESGKAWNTVIKLAFVMAGITLAWLIDTFVLDFMNLRLANLFTGFVCGVEFWSYLENAAEISEHPIFRKLGLVMKKRLEANIDNQNTGDEQRI